LREGKLQDCGKEECNKGPDHNAIIG